MGNLTNNFNREEYACRHGVDNVDPALADGMQEYRDLIGVPVRITSACRCDACGPNQAYHHASATKPGKAADSIALGGKDLLDMYIAALQVPTFRDGGIGIYPQSAEEPLKGFVHLDSREKVGRWARVEGQYVTHQEGLDFIYQSLIAKGVDAYQVDSLQTNGHTYRVPRVR